jgi:hypothetical protein
MEMAPVLPIAQGMKQVLLRMISHETLAEVHMWIFRTKSCYRRFLPVGISAIDCVVGDHVISPPLRIREEGYHHLDKHSEFEVPVHEAGK